MAYTTLYRKFRPQTFEDVYGQDHIVTALRNQIISDRIGHAYIFSGTRGTGKTTIAKIFAKAINCEHPVNGSPCGNCSSCKQIADNSALNVVEIDGASNNGIDNIRGIIEEISYPPVSGKYKVYIIDEAHAVTKDAFNALLKTLEEPPSYVVFILATTESGQLLNTIRSRCQQYDFHRISLSMIEERLAYVISSEGLSAQEKAIRYMARMADGSLRDGISLLDQCIAFSEGNELCYDKVLEVLGAVDTTFFSRLVRWIHQTDVTNSLRVVDEIIADGKEPSVFATDFVWYLRNLLLVKSGEDLENILDISTENQVLLAEEAKMISQDTLIRYIRVLSEAIAQLRYSPVKRVTLETAIVRLCRPQMEQDMAALMHRVEILERLIETGGFVKSNEAIREKEYIPPTEKEEAPLLEEGIISQKEEEVPLSEEDIISHREEEVPLSEEDIISQKEMAPLPEDDITSQKENVSPLDKDYATAEGRLPSYWKQIQFSNPTFSFGLSEDMIVATSDTNIEIHLNPEDPMHTMVWVDLSQKDVFDVFKKEIEKAAKVEVKVTVVEEKTKPVTKEQQKISMQETITHIGEVFGKEVETEDF